MIGGDIQPAEPRQTAQVRFPDGRVFEGPVGASLSDFIKAAYPPNEHPIVAAMADGQLRELHYRVGRDMEVQPIDTFTTDGLRIYQRSLSFLLVVAIHKLHPDTQVIIDHSVTLGGFFCQLRGRPLFSQEELDEITALMREIAAADEPIEKVTMPTEEARELFRSQGYDDKVRLLSYRDEKEISVYSLCGVRDYFYGYMMPGTGQLGDFHLERYPPGIILRIERKQHVFPLQSHEDYPHLMGVFREYGRWLNILGIEDVGSLNQAVQNGDIHRAVLVSEALHEKHISDIADQITAGARDVRVVLIAGPSSSGKTTFARRLAVQIMVNGMTPFALAIDDYFVNREDSPRDASGDYDFEALEAVDLDRFQADLLALAQGKQVTLPRFNFHTGRREVGPQVQLGRDSIILAEGIHGLNPRLLGDLPTEKVFRVYVSALTQLNIDHHNRVPTTDTRLLRRIVRDARSRGYTARQTIERWKSVRRGEERNIFPYQENADVMFNSALVYELSVIKPFAEPLLLRVPSGTLAALEAKRLLAFLEWVLPSQPNVVPDNSLLREFVGGSAFEGFEF